MFIMYNYYTCVKTAGFDVRVFVVKVYNGFVIICYLFFHV